MWRSKHRRELEKVLLAILGRLRAIESAPPPDDHRPAIDSLQANLDDLTDNEASVSELQVQLRGLSARVEALAESLSARIEGLGTESDRTMAAITELHDEAKRTTLAVADGIERVDRAHHRIKATVARAKAELKKLGYSDPGVEAEDRELRLVDGEGSDTGGLQPVQKEVGSPQDAPSSVKGVTLGQLQRGREQAQ